MGLQHMLAMIGGIITPPRLLANRGCLLGRDPALCAITPYLISSAMLASGILTIIQITRIKLCGGYYLGTGLISVMGTSFTFLPIGEAIIDGEIFGGGSGLEGYGKVGRAPARARPRGSPPPVRARPRARARPPARRRVRPADAPRRRPRRRSSSARAWSAPSSRSSSRSCRRGR